MMPMPAVVHVVPVALVLAVMTPHPSDSASVAYDVFPIPTVNPHEVPSNGSNALMPSHARLCLGHQWEEVPRFSGWSTVHQQAGIHGRTNLGVSAI
ncbi:hypothetical protein VitviT2T_022903 [Vitis vinifera]|uniref:Secreted protein n=1 Tax=Vitis vinifera TaxID=29760 RepID=A0ABY9DE80_VITVI|nr:hypothetical protein VitviT2T_022903 [Vitis vinifera]